MRADYEQIPEDTAYPMNAAFNEDEDQKVEPRRRLATRSRPRDDHQEDTNEPRSQYYYVDPERREYRHSSPTPCRMIQSTKPNYTRWAQPASIDEEPVPEGEDPENHTFTQSEAQGLETGRQLYIDNHWRDPPANWTPWR